MKILLSILVFNLMLMITCHAQQKSNKQIKIENEIEQDSTKLGWPKDMTGLIQHLNSWDKEELDVYERPGIYPNQITSSETNGWIEKHKTLLKELGARAVWNAKLKEYKLEKN